MKPEEFPRGPSQPGQCQSSRPVTTIISKLSNITGFEKMKTPISFTYGFRNRSVPGPLSRTPQQQPMPMLSGEEGEGAGLLAGLQERG